MKTKEEINQELYRVLKDLEQGKISADHGESNIWDFMEVYASIKQDELIEKIVKKTYEIVVDEKYYTEPLDNAEMIKDWLKSLKS